MINIIHIGRLKPMSIEKDTPKLARISCQGSRRWPGRRILVAQSMSLHQDRGGVHCRPGDHRGCREGAACCRGAPCEGLGYPRRGHLA